MSVHSSIQQKLSQRFHPEFVDVVNESHQHNVPANSETHFKIILVTLSFSGLSLVKRHQAVYALLKEEMDAGVHALALHLFTPDEWLTRNHSVHESPQCLGGSKTG